jgi:hypothetical protein
MAQHLTNWRRICTNNAEANCVDDMSVAPETVISSGTRPRTSWWDLLLYAVVAIILSTAGGLAIALAFREITALSTALTLAVNATAMVGAVYFLGVYRKKLTWADTGIVPFQWRWSWLLLAILIFFVVTPVRMVLAGIVQFLQGAGGDAGLDLRSQLVAGGGFSVASFLVWVWLLRLSRSYSSAA